MAILKWFTIPTLIIISQILFDAFDAFDSDAVLLAFVVLSVLTLYVWRCRFAKALKALMPPDGYPNVETLELEQISPSDRRFVVLSMMFPYVILFLVKLAIVAVLVLNLSVVRSHIGCIWTVLGVLAIGCYEIATFIRYLIVKHSTRWQRIFMVNSTRPAEP